MSYVPPPKLTIITASYNRAQTLEKSILSVLNQNYPSLEYIIIDGGSTDGSVDVIKKYEKHLSYWVSEPDKGIADAWNKGIITSTGEIISMLNSDDWYEPHVFNTVAIILQQNPSIDVVHGNVRYWSNNKNLYIKRPYLKQGAIWRLMPYLFPSCFIKRSLYERYGLFKTSYKITMDYELMLRFFIHGATFMYIDEIMANFQLGGLSDAKCITGLIENKDITIHYGYSKVKSYLNLCWLIIRRYLTLSLEKAHFGFIVEIAKKLSGRWSYE